MKLLQDLFDKFLFTAAFITGIQLPAFIHSYVQHISGRLAEAKIELKNFEAIANIQFSGELNQLIQHFLKNTDSTIQATGQLIVDLINRVENYQTQLDALTHENYFYNIKGFIIYFDPSIAKETAMHYVPNIPLSISAISTGLVVALTMSLAFNGTCSCCAFVAKKARQNKAEAIQH